MRVPTDTAAEAEEYAADRRIVERWALNCPSLRECCFRTSFFAQCNFVFPDICCRWECMAVTGGEMDTECRGRSYGASLQEKRRSIKKSLQDEGLYQRELTSFCSHEVNLLYAKSSVPSACLRGDMVTPSQIADPVPKEDKCLYSETNPSARMRASLTSSKTFQPREDGGISATSREEVSGLSSWEGDPRIVVRLLRAKNKEMY